MRGLTLVALAILVVAVLVVPGLLEQATESSGPVLTGPLAKPNAYNPDPNATFPTPRLPAGIEAAVVPAVVTEGEASYSASRMPGAGEIYSFERALPAGRRNSEVAASVPTNPVPKNLTAIWAEEAPAPQAPRAPLISRSFESTEFDDNGPNTGGYRFIPPDPIGAAGPDHLVNVVNVTVRFHQKSGVLQFDDSLANFFASLSPANFTFDPKVIYDQYEDRFVIVTLEVVDDGSCASQSACTSRILLAVSDDSDPNGTWYFTAINAEQFFSGYEHWADYPGFAIDEEAVYVTCNMFRYDAGIVVIPDDYYSKGTRLWIVDKGTGGGFYTGAAASVSVYDPYAGFPAYYGTTQPAHIFGTGLSGNVGTFLVSAGWSDGTNEYLQVVRVDSPLGSPVFSQQFVGLGDIESAGSLPDAPQAGTGIDVEVNDRRALHAVWRNDSLYATGTILPNSGPDNGQTTAAWWQIDTSSLGTLSLTDQGQIGGEDIASGTYTFFPSIAVNSDDHVVIGFAASASSIYPGSYFTTRLPSYASGVTSGSQVLRAGTDYYYRAFGGSRNRWGDYTGTAVDPDTNCFWVYNQHAMARGTIFGSYPTEDGRWSTAWGEVCTSMFRTIITDPEEEPAPGPETK
jgi:hypothetical protein